MRYLKSLFLFFAIIISSQVVANSGREVDLGKEWGRVPEWGDSWPSTPRITIRWPRGVPGLPYRLEMKVDGKSFETLPILEGGGADPVVHVLNKNLIAYLGCGKIIPETSDVNCSNIWRIFRIKEKTAFPIQLEDFEQRLGMPVFQDSYMGFAARLPNGHNGCKVYDWSSNRFVAQWDSGSNTWGIAISFNRDRSAVSCKEIVEWKPNPGYQGGDGPREIPVYGKVYVMHLGVKS